ncbi:hypothetical protein HYFRA_00009261 [Hymenoscyphus fraxineus]|uniref:Uncharacterized protein n=1 Tax=Hymenoscyphus fraxineus TaxID=746836 RepID=A0A9N9L3I1_9HELO|nr:hypothetical protein HYFRA_00009261 [Hymenoscyphus fraxineus]
MALSSSTIEGRATVAFWQFPILDEIYIKDYQKSLVENGVTDYYDRKEQFEAIFGFLSPALEKVLSFPNRQVQFEIKAIAQEFGMMPNQVQPQSPKRPWDVYYADKVIGKHERVWKIANCMVTQYLRGGFEYSERLREIVALSGQDWIDDKCATVLAYCLFVDISRDNIPDEETQALSRLYKSLEQEISSSASSTSTSGSSSSSSGSSSDSEEIHNFRPSNQRPNIHRVESSSLADRLQAFLPNLAASNAQLASGTQGSNGFELDPNSEEPHIEMNLGLGVLEHTTPSATEPLIRESRSIRKRKATGNGTESHASKESTEEDAESRKKFRLALRPASDGRPSSSESSGSTRMGGRLVFPPSSLDTASSNASSSLPRPRITLGPPPREPEDEEPLHKLKITMKIPHYLLERVVNNEGVVKFRVKENIVEEAMAHRAEMAAMAATRREKKTAARAKQAKAAKAEKGKATEPFPEFDQEMIDAANLDVMEQVANGNVEGFEVVN